MLSDTRVIRSAIQYVRWLRATSGKSHFSRWRLWCNNLSRLAPNPVVAAAIRAELYKSLQEPVALPVAATSEETTQALALAQLFLWDDRTDSSDDAEVRALTPLHDQLVQSAAGADTAAIGRLAEEYRDTLLHLDDHRLTRPVSTRWLWRDAAVRVLLYNLALPLGPSALAVTLVLMVFLPLGTYIAAMRSTQRIQRAFGNHFQAAGKPRPQLAVHIGPNQYATLAIVLLITAATLAGLFSHLEADWGAYQLLLVLLVPVHGTVYLIVLRQLSHRRYSPNEADAWLRELAQDRGADYSPDENDAKLARLSIGLKAQQGRVEAFVLEAALFGALAFSAFVQIVATDFVDLNNILQFLDHLSTVVLQIIRGDAITWGLLAGKTSLFVLVCLQTLLCSLIFLTVVASRLRFSDTVREVDEALELARAFNDKEEFLQVSNEAPLPAPELLPRLRLLSERVRLHLETAERHLKTADGIMAFMRYFRDLGIGAFFLVLVTSALLFSQTLAVVFIAVFALGLTYHRVNAIFEAARTFWRRLEEHYLAYRRVYGVLPWVLFGLSVGFDLAEWPGGDLMAALAAVILTLSLLIQAFLPVFEVATDEAKWKLDLRKGLKVLLHLAHILFLLGYLSKQLHLPGANELLILSLGVLSAYFGFYGYPVASASYWRHLIVGQAASFGTVAILFNLLHFPGWREFALVASGVTTLGLGLLLAWPHFRKKLSRPFVRQSLVFGVLSYFIAFTPLLTYLISSPLGFRAVQQRVALGRLNRAAPEAAAPAEAAALAAAYHERFGALKALGKLYVVGDLDVSHALLTNWRAGQDTALRRQALVHLGALEAVVPSPDATDTTHYPPLNEVVELEALLLAAQGDSVQAAARLRAAARNRPIDTTYQLFAFWPSDALPPLAAQSSALRARLGLPSVWRKDASGWHYGAATAP
ncbi:MAG: hypothetical protein SFY70_13165 [Bacteroidia bacterium]|nr:hypothetical protein [Bacteroidia bacterium]